MWSIGADIESGSHMLQATWHVTDVMHKQQANRRRSITEMAY